jgi:hypothetical protein
MQSAMIASSSPQIETPQRVAGGATAPRLAA